MRMTATTSVTIFDKQVTAYAGPTSWPDDVQVGIYFNAADLTAALGPGLAPSIEAELPDRGTVEVCSGWTAAATLLNQDGRKADWRELILATRQADEAFDDTLRGYDWQAI